jgi:hypothetical protein
VLKFTESNHFGLEAGTLLVKLNVVNCYPFILLYWLSMMSIKRALTLTLALTLALLASLSEQLKLRNQRPKYLMLVDKD